MGKCFFAIVIFSLSLTTVAAQKTELLVKKSDKGLYLDHTVKPKESFYALGRRYNIDPKQIASFNSLDYNKGLLIDQKLRIPLTEANFLQEGNKGTPVYYKVGDNESLDKISLNNNTVLKSNIRWWNNLKSDEVKAGTKLIVGFINSPSMASITIAGKPVPEETIFHTKEGNNDEALEEVKKPEEKKPEPGVLTEEVKKPEPAVVKEKVMPVTNGEGFFKSHFEQQARLIPPVKTATVTSGIFKTTSGWEDAKYYMLIDSLQPGTIVKVTNPANNKSIFAKVLGQMSGIRQNAGLDIRISNAAASVLEIAEDDKFIVNVNY